MDLKDLDSLGDTYSSTEVRIIIDYFSGKSIRQLATENKRFGYGRTKIRNLIERCAIEHSSLNEEKDKILLKNKTHKKNTDDYNEKLELTEEQVRKAYEDILNGTTLTEVARQYERTRDFIKARIIDYINDEEEEKEFLEILKSNKHSQNKNDFLEASEEVSKKIIFDRLNKRRKANKRPEYSDSFLEKKYLRIKKYFLETRNEELVENKISEKEFLKMLYDTPTLLSSSLRSKIIPAVENLDNNKSIGAENTNRIIKEDASILCSSIQRTNLQIKILEDNGLLEECLLKPRNFRTSPEMLYALIELYNNKEIKKSSLFITKSRLEKKYRLTPEKLIEKYNIREKYGDDPYFER